MIRSTLTKLIFIVLIVVFILLPSADSAEQDVRGDQTFNIMYPLVKPLPCLSDEQWVGQTLMVLASPTDMPRIKTGAVTGYFGGVVLVKDFDGSIIQDIQDLQSASPLPLMIASDEEGGRVQRLRALFGDLPSARELSGLPLESVEAMMYDYAAKLRQAGIDAVFAPVVDVGAAPGITDRSFSDSVENVSLYASAVARGFERAAVLPVYKHFPGHGSANIDSHVELPVTDSYDSLLQGELRVYDQLLQGKKVGVMVGHLRVPGLSSGPTSLSKDTVSRLLRGNDEGFAGKSYEFDGLVFSDALNMGAIQSTYSTAQATVLALDAGVDIVLASGPDQIEGVLGEVFQALESGQLSWKEVDESVKRILDFKNLSYVRCSMRTQ